MGAEAAKELSDAEEITTFRKWLDRNNAYVFTINGFPMEISMVPGLKSRYTDRIGRLPKTGLHTPPIYHPGRTPEPGEEECKHIAGSFKEFLPDRNILKS